MKKAVLWLHEGDEEPTFYPSIASLARVLGCSTTNACYHVRNGVCSDRALKEAQDLRDYRLAKPCEYKGVQYKSIADMQKAFGIHWRDARKMLDGGDEPKKPRKIKLEKKMRYNKQGFTYQGREYESLTEFQKVHECGRKLAERARRGDDITASLAKKTAKSVHSSFLEKASKAQELANRALKGAK